MSWDKAKMQSGLEQATQLLRRPFPIVLIMTTGGQMLTLLYCPVHAQNRNGGELEYNQDAARQKLCDWIDANGKRWVLPVKSVGREQCCCVWLLVLVIMNCCAC